MKLFLTVVILHFLEHLAQIYQLYVLHLARVDCLGILGLWQPWIVREEWLHFGYAVVMLVGLVKLNISRTATNLQAFHTIEHSILMAQFLLGLTTTGIGGLWFPRIELHFFYNLMVIIPMAIAYQYRRGVSI